MKALEELVSAGRIARAPQARGWLAEPHDIVDALAREGFAEFKADAARSRRDRAPTGGIWPRPRRPHRCGRGGDLDP